MFKILLKIVSFIDEKEPIHRKAFTKLGRILTFQV